MLRVNEEDPDLEDYYMDLGGSMVYRYKGERFTGIMETYYVNGILESEIEYQNGYEEGWQRFYYDNGQLERELNIHNNLTVANTYKEYDEDGNLLTSW